MPFTIALTPYVVHKVPQAVVGLFCSNLQALVRQLCSTMSRTDSFLTECFVTVSKKVSNHYIAIYITAMLYG